jgi:hypothetical protein
MATNQPLVHYAMDLESPPIAVCDTPAMGAFHTAIASDVTCPRCRASEQFPQQAVKAPRISPYDVLQSAADLLSDDGENPEYDRAIAELTSSLIGGGADDRVLITRILRSLKEA